MARQPFSRLDSAWLRFDEPTNPMVTTVALLFDEPLHWGNLRHIVQERLLRFERFHQRAIRPQTAWGRFSWEDDPGVDLDAHLRRATLPQGSSEAELREVVAELVSTRLDTSQPLWQFHLIENVGPGCALVCRVHHCLADGPALLKVLWAMADPAQNPPPLFSAVARPDGRFRPIALRPPLGSALMAAKPGQSGLEAVLDPFGFLGQGMLDASRVAVLGKLLLRAPDSPSALRGELGIAKQVGWSRPMALADAKAAGHAARATVNDVLLASISGALRRYLQGRGEHADGTTVRAGLSVGLRPGEADAELGNHAGAVLVTLPVNVEDPVKRLRLVHTQMEELKRSPEALVISALLAWLGEGPPEVQQAIVRLFCTRETAVIANVAGPAERLCLAGVPIRAIVGWIPAFGRVGLTLCAISYAGDVRLGVATDQGLVPDPETLVAAFETELALLGALSHESLTDGSGDPLALAGSQSMHSLLDAAARGLDSLMER